MKSQVIWFHGQLITEVEKRQRNVSTREITMTMRHLSKGCGTYIIRADFYGRLPGEILATQAGVATLHTIRHTA